jgi:hypothetical protein
MTGMVRGAPPGSGPAIDFLLAAHHDCLFLHAAVDMLLLCCTPHLLPLLCM